MRNRLFGMLGLGALGTASLLAPPALHADPEGSRTLSFYQIHTKESLTVTYKMKGRFVPEAMKKINWILRDWRNDSVKTIDRRTIDIIWEMHTELGSKKPVHIISGYRSRATNNMLRRTRGGQASNSYHITGKAVDIHFPDVPVRFVRYAALIRQRGGVGYYPTSALPFVHVDSGRVRHWPRMNTYEMALLFPNGRSKHIPSSGRRLKPGDVQKARATRGDLVKHLAAYHEIRKRPKTATVIASARGPGEVIVPPKPQPATRPPVTDWSRTVVADARRKPALEVKPAESTPKSTELALAAAQQQWQPSPPRPVLRSEEPTVVFQPSPSEADRARLDSLIAAASFVPLAEPPRLIRSAALTGRPSPDRNAGAPSQITKIAPEKPSAASDRDALSRLIGQATAIRPAQNGERSRFDWGAGSLVAVVDDDAWAAAPEYDEDHPDELAYRPFPIEPLMTSTPNDPSLAIMERVEHRKTLAFLSDEPFSEPMQLRPPKQVAQLMWRQEFSGAAVQIFDDRKALSPAEDWSARSVRTTRE